MSKELEGPEVAYSWGVLSKSEQPNKVITAAVADSDQSFEFFRSEVWGEAGDVQWCTLSWLEIAFSQTTGDYRILWISGIGPTLELPEHILTNWGNATDPENALQQMVLALDARGETMLGVCDVVEVRDGIRGYRVAPVVSGFDLEIRQ